jgi:hypothetical protein
MSETIFQRCRNCEGFWERDVAFRRNHDARLAMASRGFHAVCIGCEQTARERGPMRNY